MQRTYKQAISMDELRTRAKAFTERQEQFRNTSEDEEPSDEDGVLAMSESLGPSLQSVADGKCPKGSPQKSNVSVVGDGCSTKKSRTPLRSFCSWSSDGRANQSDGEDSDGDVEPYVAKIKGLGITRILSNQRCGHQKRRLSELLE